MTIIGEQIALQPPISPHRDHIRGSGTPEDAGSLLIYGDYLCPYCRRLRGVVERLRHSLGDRMIYVFRNFPNERAHPGAELASAAAEAAARQDRFWAMHDELFNREPPLTREHLLEAAGSIGVDMDVFVKDLDSSEVKTRIEEDLADGRGNGVTGTPTLFVDGQRYDGAWDFYSLLEALESV